MLNKKVEFAVLQVLKQCRAEMVQDFLDHKPEIYLPSYKYENSPVLLKLAKEKYFTAWLSKHWPVFTNVTEQFSIEERRFAETIFAHVFLELLGKWSFIKTTEPCQLILGIKLINDMQTALNQLIKVGEIADLMSNKLKLALEKNCRLFDRAIKELEEKS